MTLETEWRPPSGKINEVIPIQALLLSLNAELKQKHSHFNSSIVRFLDEKHSNSKVLKATVNSKGTNLQDPIL